MVKILVADDNSNIQKMVGLALKDQGIDVVAVGNGEAAVRKISDVRPDLVLADVFMPVRNGYEVCQYVKTDSTLAHIPVILLVGAFDPLDEQEAQRVGADGVLKKPFVPPDPLISMVKSALARAGVMTPAGGSAKTPEPEPAGASDFLTRHTAPVPKVSSIPVHPELQEMPVAPLEMESFVDEVPVHPEPLKIDSGAQPVAFGNLLETPAEEVQEEEDPGFIGTAHPELVPERDWRDLDEEETEEATEEEEEAAPKWRREDADEAHAGAASKPESADWRAGSFEQNQSRKAHTPDWEPAEEKPEVAAPANAAPAESPVEQKLAETAPLAPVAAASPFAADAWASVTASAAAENAAKEPQEAPHSVSESQEKIATLAADVPEAALPEPGQKSNGNSWFSVASNPWDAEIQKASRLASAWDSAVAPTAAVASETAPVAAANESSSEAVESVIEEAALPAATVEAIREEAAQVTQDATPPAGAESAGETTFYAHEEIVEATPQAPAPSMDELVAKVLAKMSPEVLQAVTREILKPVVEAMVKEELKSKKS